MGKTVQIDDDVMRAAEEIAAERGVAVDRIVSDLARHTLTCSRLSLIERNGFLVLPARGGVVTVEDVERMIEEADLEDAGPLLATC